MSKFKIECEEGVEVKRMRRSLSRVLLALAEERKQVGVRAGRIKRRRNCCDWTRQSLRRWYHDTKSLSHCPKSQCVVMVRSALSGIIQPILGPSACFLSVTFLLPFFRALFSKVQYSTVPHTPTSNIPRLVCLCASSTSYHPHSTLF